MDAFVKLASELGKLITLCQALLLVFEGRLLTWHATGTTRRVMLLWSFWFVALWGLLRYWIEWIFSLRNFPRNIACIKTLGGCRRQTRFTRSSKAQPNRAISHDDTAAILVFQNKERTAAILVYQTNPWGIELYFSSNVVFCFRYPIWLLATWVKTLYTSISTRSIRHDTRQNSCLPPPWQEFGKKKI